ncbi:L domain-like protein [Anaeromyces robustus]|uniref:L domain-like protein n=1 Tax=Anaeromyces robustus TaxID=1754192 RepID=A0A1Y1WUP8_9FUNG|nr:L domain-like protein [Anaeromyces robustus]|eukprot:ORX77277.1 L domain-like protein [Anaeromyces robustus]
MFKLLLFIATLITKILANDCSYFKNSIKYLSFYQYNFLENTNCCEVKGITCDSEYHIIKIMLNNIDDPDNISNALYSFQNLKYLHTLELKNVKTNGAIPNHIFNLKNLKTLIISDNCDDYYNKIIPDKFEKLKKLEYLDLSNNCFQGPVPKSLILLKKLKYFIPKPKQTINLVKVNNEHNEHNDQLLLKSNISNKESKNNNEITNNKNINNNKLILGCNQYNTIPVLITPNNSSQYLLENQVNVIKPPQLNHVTLHLKNNKFLKPTAPAYDNSDIILNATAPPEKIVFS